MQNVKGVTDLLASLEKPQDPEDVIDVVLKGVGSSFQTVIDGVHARDTVISFAELHEKLLNKELHLKLSDPATSTPTTAMTMTYRPKPKNNDRPSPTPSRSNSYPRPNTPPRPYPNQPQFPTSTNRPLPFVASANGAGSKDM